MKFSTKLRIIRGIKALTDKILSYPMQDFIKRKLGGTYLSQVEFHIVDHCNLNCANCDHFTPLAEENYIEISSVVEDFKLLKEVYDIVENIYIVGGEPLLHPKLTEVFEPLRNIYPESNIIIVTNGILLNKQNDEFWQKLKEYNIALNITKYPLKIDYDCCEDKCRDFGIAVKFFSFNRDMMQKMDLDTKGRSDKNKAFMKCSRRVCHFLREGKLYMCTPVPNIRFLNKYFNLNFEVNKNDYVDLTKEKSASKINALFSRPIDFCRYCSDGDLPCVKYGVSKKEKTEWLKDN